LGFGEGGGQAIGVDEFDLVGMEVDVVAEEGAAHAPVAEGAIPALGSPLKDIGDSLLVVHGGLFYSMLGDFSRVEGL
jgi:hypothetical protein